MKTKDLKQGRWYAVRTYHRETPRRMKLVNVTADYTEDGALRRDDQKRQGTWFRAGRLLMQETGARSPRGVLPRHIIRLWSEQATINTAQEEVQAGHEVEYARRRKKYARQHREMISTLRAAGFRGGRDYEPASLLDSDYKEYFPQEKLDEEDTPTITFTLAGIAKLGELLNPQETTS